MRVKVAIPEHQVTAPVLDAALESVTRLNEQMLETGEVPTFERALRTTGVQWRPEPPGDEHFDSADRVMKRRAGDCDDLAPWHAASLRHTGEDPGATAVVRRSGPKRWHAVVQRSDGSIDDPSLRAGMGPGVSPMPPGVMGAVLPLMLAPAWRSEVGGVGAYILRPQIAIRNHYGQAQARADLPWYWREHMMHDKPSSADLAMTALHRAPVASTALTGAIQDVVTLGTICGAASQHDIDKLCAIADACEGYSYNELASIYGPDVAEAATAVVGSLFGKLGKLAKGVVRRAVPMAASFVPGGSAALKLAKGVLPGRRQSHPGAAPQQALNRPPARAPAPAARPAPARDAPFAAVDQQGRTTVVHFH